MSEEVNPVVEAKRKTFTPGPWTADIGDRLSDDGDCWVVDSPEGSISSW